jgi:hypothetical protein
MLMHQRHIDSLKNKLKHCIKPRCLSLIFDGKFNSFLRNVFKQEITDVRSSTILRFFVNLKNLIETY